MTHPEGPSWEQLYASGVPLPELPADEAAMFLNMDEQFAVRCRCLWNNGNKVRRFADCPVHGPKKNQP